MRGDIGARHRFRDRRDRAVEQDQHIARTLRIERGAHAVQNAPVLRVGSRHRHPRKFAVGVDRGDLRVGAGNGDQRIDHAVLLLRRKPAIDVEIARRAIGIEQRALFGGNAGARGDRLGQPVRAQRIVHPHGGGQRLLVRAFGRVQPAVVGAQHHRVIDPARVEVRQQLADRGIDFGHLDAHFHALVADRVADVVGRGKADGEQIGRGALPQLHFINQPDRELGRGLVHTRRNAQSIALRTRLQLEPPGADGGLADRDRPVLRAAPRARVQRGRAGFQHFGHGGILRLHGGGQLAPLEGDEGAALPPVSGVDLVPAHHHHRAVLRRYGNVAAGRVGALHPFAQRGHFQQAGGHHRIARGAGRIAEVFGAIDPLVRAGDAGIEPVVGDDPVARRVRAGQQGGVAGASLGRGVRLIAGWEHRPFLQPLQPAGVMAAILGEQVGGELVDRDRQHQLWSRLGGNLGRGNRRGRFIGQCGRGERGSKRKGGDQGETAHRAILLGRYLARPPRYGPRARLRDGYGTGK